jgi:AcrR family transcriptional regulator
MDDIGAALDMKGPSLYKHVRSKQDLLAELMSRSIHTVQAAHDAAVATTDDVSLQLRRAVEAHVRFHARNRLDAFLGSRELGSLAAEHRAGIVHLRKAYERSFRRLVDAGVAAGRFRVTSPKLTTFALLDMGTGVAVWFRDDGDASVDEVAYLYGDLAMRLVGSAG